MSISGKWARWTHYLTGESPLVSRKTVKARVEHHRRIVEAAAQERFERERDRVDSVLNRLASVRIEREDRGGDLELAARVRLSRYLFETGYPNDRQFWLYVAESLTREFHAALMEMDMGKVVPREVPIDTGWRRFWKSKH